jgi:hypothetical protein
MRSHFLITGITAALAAALPARANLFVNGDFAQNGAVGFSSQYQFSPGNLVPAGRYDTPGSAMDLTDDNGAFVWPGDHTAGGNTRILAANGATNGTSVVWSQTVTLQAATLYGFSAWVSSLVATSPATLKFSAGAGQLGNVFAAPANTNNWAEFTSSPIVSGAGALSPSPSSTRTRRPTATISRLTTSFSLRFPSPAPCCWA